MPNFPSADTSPLVYVLGAIGAGLTTVGAAVSGLLLGLRRVSRVEEPVGKATIQLTGSTAAREEVAAAVEMIHTQREIISGYAEQLSEALGNEREARDSARVAEVAAERAQADLERAKREADKREHELINERLEVVARVERVEREKVALEAQLGITERRSM